jgi:hypothetical protein
MESEAGSRRPLLVVLFLGALLFGWLAWTVDTRGVAPPSRAGHECRDRYASAATSRDTLRIDLTYPTEYAQELDGLSKPRTCGELRREELLPR